MVIRVKGVKKVVAKGRTYYYHRKSGRRIEAPHGTLAFADEVRQLDQRVRPKQQADSRARAGTFGELVNAYRTSPEFTGLAERTKKDYQRILNYLKPLHDIHLSAFDAAQIWAIRDKANAKHKRRFANYVLQVLSRLFSWGGKRGMMVGNPAASVEHVRRPRDARKVNRAWREAEVNAVLEAAPPALRVPIAIGLYTGLREGDVIRITWAAYDGEAFETRQGKTGAPIWIPAHKRLREILDVAPRDGSTQIVVGSRGRPFTENGFQSRFFKFIRKLAAAGTVGTGLTFHGLRHTAGKMMADVGCDTGTIAAVLGHADEKMAAHYSKEADQRRRAKVAMGKLERTSDKKWKTARKKVEN
jgi:integrase